MSLTEQIAMMMVEGLDSRERIDLILKLADHLMSTLGPEDRKELVREMLPRTLESIFADLEPKDRAELVRSVMPNIMDLLMGPPTHPGRGQP